MRGERSTVVENIYFGSFRSESVRKIMVEALGGAAATLEYARGLNDLAGEKRWVAWREESREGKPRKMPKNPATGGNAQVPTNPATYGTRAAAERCWQKIKKEDETGGIGIVLGDTLVGSDLDSCRDPESGEIAGWAKEVIARFDTYAEVSPSGTGVKLFFTMSAEGKGKLQALLGLNAKGEPLTRKTFAAGEHREVAIDTARFYAVTGQRLESSPEELRRVAFRDVEWFIKEAGPRYLEAQKHGNGGDPFAQYGESHTTQHDESGSGHGFRFMRQCHADGMSFEEACEAILGDEEDAGEWANRVDDRQLTRAWENSKPKVEDAAQPVPPKLVLSLADWAARDLPEPDCILGEVLSTTTRMLLAADTGIGKTLFSLAIGMRCALGCDFLQWQGIRPARVLYIDGEMSRRQLKKRLIDESLRLGTIPETFFALSREDVDGLQPLNTPAGQKTIEAVIRDHCGGAIDLIMFDNIMALISGNHSEEEGWAKTMPWVRDLTRRAIGQFWIHHTGHDASRQYGTKTREWEMDAYAQLDKVERDDTDVSFLLNFRKARERTPDNRQQFGDTNIALVSNKWTYESSGELRKLKLSPEGQKYFECLRALAGPGKPGEFFEHPRALIEDWRQACFKRGLLDPNGKENTARSLFSKYKRELITRNWITCDETTAQVLP